jgi:hypothetical protein
MSKDIYFTHYAPMGTFRKDCGKQVPEELQIEVYYTLGGPNYFCGGMTKRGIWLSFTPMTRWSGGKSLLIGDPRGRRMLCEELPRRNDKRGEVWAKIMSDCIEDIEAPAIAQDWAAVHDIVMAHMEKEVA